MNILLQVVPLLLGLAVVCTWLWSSGWAARDASRRGKPGWLVGVLVLLLCWPISLLVWIALRPNDPRPPFDLERFRTQ